MKAEVEASQREAELLRAKNDELSAANEEKARLLDILGRQADQAKRAGRNRVIAPD